MRERRRWRTAWRSGSLVSTARRHARPRRQGLSRRRALPQRRPRRTEKDEVLAWQPGAPERREAAVTILDRKGNRTFEARVDLAKKRVLSLKPVEGVQPLVLMIVIDGK